MSGTYNPIPTVSPQANPSDRYQRIQPQAPAPGAHGEFTAQGYQAISQGAFKAGAFFEEAAADDAANKYQEGVNAILYGKPGEMVQGADGKPTPDTGYMGLKGRAALDARPDVEKRIDELRVSLKKGLIGRGDLQFDNFSRRFKAITDQQVGNHARTQGNVYATHVNQASAKLALEDIARNADSAEGYAHAESDLIGAYMKQAQLEGGGPEVEKEAFTRARRDALVARLSMIGTTDPSRAMRMLEKNRDIAGTQYDNLYNHFRARADVQDGKAYADTLVQGGTPSAEGQSANLTAVRNNAESALRAKGIPVNVTSTTRTPEQNAAAGGAKDSQHLHGNAIDISLKGLSEDQKKEVVSTYLSQPGVGGFGYYPDSDSIHVDVRGGARTAWGQDKTSGSVGKNWPEWMKQSVSQWQGAGPAPGRPSLASYPDMIKKIMDDPVLQQRPQAQAAALHRLSQTYSAAQSIQAKQQAAFETAVKDSESEALTTGQTSNPIAREHFIAQWGDIKGPVEYQKYIDNVQYGADYKAMQDMSSVQMDQLIAGRMPKPGQPGYANVMANIQRLQKGRDNLLQERTENPAGAVSRMPVVMDAVASYNEKDPASFQRVVEARMAAQEQLGIEENARSPITKKEALANSRPVALALPGQKYGALEKMGEQYRQMYGRFAAQAFLYTIKAMHLEGKTAADAEGIVDSLLSGAPVTEQERREARERDQAAQIEAALQAKGGGEQPAWMTDPGASFSMFGTPTMPAGSPREPAKPTPNSQAIRDLKSGKLPPTEFDKLFGAGASKRLIDTYPLYFGQQKQ